MTFLRTTEIPSLIESHNFSSTRVLNEELFPLLEQDAPALCADRVDYGLRDSLAFGTLSLRDALFIAGDLREFEGKIICSTKESAVILSEACKFCHCFQAHDRRRLGASIIVALDYSRRVNFLVSLD